MKDSIFSRKNVSTLEKAWAASIGAVPADQAAFPLEARRAMLELLGWDGSAEPETNGQAVVAGFFFRDNDGNGRYTPGEEFSAALLGRPRLEGGNTPEAEVHARCYWIGPVSPGTYTFLYDVDGVEKISMPIDVTPGINVVHAKAALTKPLVYVVPHSHFDPEWMSTYEEYVAREIPNMLARLELLKTDPNHVFCLDEECASRPLIERHPEIIDELRVRIRDGMVEPKALVAAGDLHMPLGESMIRQITVGERVLSELLEMPVTSDVFWNVDNYGISFQLPQILLKTGRPFCLVGEYHWSPPEAIREIQRMEWWEKAGWNFGNPHFKEDMPFSDPEAWNHTEFWLEGLDGSRVLIHHSPYWMCPYGRPIKVSDFCSHLSAFNFYGHDFAAPEPELAERLLWSNEKEKDYNCIIATAPEFFRAVASAPDVPTIRTESFIAAWTGCYESRVKGRQLSRRQEGTMLSAEALGVIASVNGMEYPDRELLEAWYLLMINHHHDPQMTPMGPGLFDEVIDRYLEVEQRASAVIRKCLEHISGKVKTNEQEGIPVTVVNPVPWERSECTSVAAGIAGAGWELCDGNGASIPSQVTSDGKIRFLAGRMPPLGWRTYYLRESGAHTASSGPVVKEEVMENDFLRVELAHGRITRVVEKTGGNCVVSGTAEAAVNELFVWKDEGCICEIRPVNFFEQAELAGRSSQVVPAVSLVESGPASGVVETRFDLDWGTFRQRVILEAATPYIRFETDVEWKCAGEGGRRVRVAFPSSTKGMQAWRDVAFGVTPSEQTDRIRPVNSWVGMGAAETGFGAALIHQGTCSAQLTDDVIWMTLFRSVRMTEKCPWGWDVIGDEAHEEGFNTYTYWLYPYAGDWRQAAVPRVAMQVSAPLSCLTGRRHDGTPAPDNGLLCVAPSGVSVSAVKNAERGHGRIVRLFNPDDTRVTALLEAGFTVAEVRETDFLEQDTGTLPVRQGKVRLDLGPYQIRTVRLLS